MVRNCSTTSPRRCLSLFLTTLIAGALSIYSVPALSAEPAPQASASDQAAPVEAIANQIFGEVMSPFCPGRLLKDCPSGQANELKDKIRGQLSRGEPAQSIVEGLYRTFGEELRAAPKNSGFGQLAWITPFIFVAIGLIVLTVWLRRSSAQGEPSIGEKRSESEQKSLSPDIAKRIEEEMNRSQ